MYDLGINSCKNTGFVLREVFWKVLDINYKLYKGIETVVSLKWLQFLLFRNVMVQYFF